MKKDFLSVVLLNYNMKGLIKVALDSLHKSSYDKSKYEVIVIDNDSTDGADKYIEDNYPRVRLVRSGKNVGYAAMNLALKHAKGEYIFFLNNDLAFDRDCLKNLMKAVKELPDDVAAVTPLRKDFTTHKPSYHRKFISRCFYNYSETYDNPEKYYEDGFTGFPLYKRKVLDELGTFIDPDYFMYAEDVDFCYRTRMLGYRIILVTDAVIYNMGRVTSRKFLGSRKINYLSERNLLQTFFKDVQFRNLFIYLPYVVLMRLLSMVADLLTLRFASFFMKLRAYFWVLLHLPHILAKRGPVQQKRVVSDRKIFKMIGNEWVFIKYLFRNVFRR